MLNFSRLKKPLFVIAFILLVILMGYLLWKLFFQASSPEQDLSSQTSTATSGGLPIIDYGDTQSPDELTDPGHLPDGSIPGEEEIDSPIGPIIQTQQGRRQ